MVPDLQNEVPVLKTEVPDLDPAEFKPECRRIYWRARQLEGNLHVMVVYVVYYNVYYAGPFYLLGGWHKRPSTEAIL